MARDLLFILVTFVAAAGIAWMLGFGASKSKKKRDTEDSDTLDDEFVE